MLQRRVLLPVILVTVLMVIASGSALGKGHVPADQFQVSHLGTTAVNVTAAQLPAHLAHGDIRLPACDNANVFGNGGDSSAVVATNVDKKGKVHKIKDHIKSKLGVLYADGAFVLRDQAASGACPPGTF